jgi:hypothetical protein
MKSLIIERGAEFLTRRLFDQLADLFRATTNEII